MSTLINGQRISLSDLYSLVLMCANGPFSPKCFGLVCRTKADSFSVG